MKKTATKVSALVISGVMLSSPIENVLANTINPNTSNNKLVNKFISDSPIIDITTNSNNSNIFNVNENFSITLNMLTDIDKNSTIKKGDKIRIQLPPNAFSRYLSDIPDSLINKVNTSFDKDTGIFEIEFNDSIKFSGTSIFRFNFIVNENKVTGYEINASYERNTLSSPITVKNNIFISSGIQNYDYKLLCPYWNINAENYIGTNNKNEGQFLSTINKASFYLDINDGYNYDGNGFSITFQLENQILIKDSLKLIRYDGVNDQIGTDVSNKIRFIDGFEDDYVTIKGKLDNKTRYRLFYDVNVINIDSELVSQFYGSAGGTEDKFNPIIKSLMVNKISDSDYIPRIFGTTRKTLKVGSTFKPLENMSAYDKEDGNLTDKVKVIKNDVNTDIPGKYEVVYEVTDSNGNTVQLTTIVTIVTNTPPIILGVKNKTIFLGDITFNPLEGVTAEDKEDGNLTDKIKVIGSVNVNKTGIYQLIYKVKDSDGNVATVKSVVTVIANEVPVIDATDKTIKVGDTFDPMAGVTAEDKEDGNLTDKVKVIKNDVNTDIPGKYEVVYEVTDNQGATSTKTITVTVLSNDAPVISGTDNISIKEGDAFDPMAGVTATDTEDGNVTDKIKVEGSVDVNKPGKYELTYTVTDSDGNTTTVKRVVTVIANEVPVIDATDKTIKVGDTFDPMAGVTAEDKEDGNLTDKVKVIKNDVNTDIPGKYEVVYEVTDNQGATSTKTITVTVLSNDAPVNTLPNTGDVTTLPYIGGLFLALGSLLKINRKKKK
ncbi:DUF5011 domain-containing protein [Clostridium perfringens]|uniref:LPXTG cell wall anchor domain-containing protein n=1 Tax=Clostridium perfringens TaxID=1502 RepID=UPI0022482617|nr:immunoglobulin-like domain-containing protein [Clostridium perfringens]MCX0365311.1 DUF5011 domain-containing protein [Clostridium perfringens]